MKDDRFTTDEYEKAPRWLSLLRNSMHKVAPLGLVLIFLLLTMEKCSKDFSEEEENPGVVNPEFFVTPTGF